MHNLLLSFGLSFNLIVSAHAPVQLTTYLTSTLNSFPPIRSLKMRPVIFPFSFLINYLNYALLTAFAGTKDNGILRPFPTVAVKMAVTSNLASLKEPS